MKVQDVITKLKVMLGAETEVVENVELTEEVVEAKMAEATLVDGTEVYTEGELEAGAILYVKVEEGDAPFAPEGMHETSEGLIVTVGENGEIVSIEEKAGEEAPAEVEATEEEVVEEAMETEEEEMEEEKKEEKAFDAEELIGAIAEMLAPQTEELKDLKEKLATLEARFNDVADQPAAKPIKNTFSQEAKAAKTKAEARFETLVALRKK